MSLFKIITIFLFLVLYQSCESQEINNKIIPGIPTIEQEATSIWRTINDINFLEKQGYKINLPQDPTIDSLVGKSKNGSFGNEDFQVIYNLLETTIYDQAAYAQAQEKVNKQKKLLNTLVQKLDQASNSWNWEFKQFASYPIVFTLYGTGGSYDPDRGVVTLFTSAEGDFMNYKNPANTIIHEIVHMGIETSIIQKYKVPHSLKERIVDTIVYLLFKELLPEYKIQNMGDKQLDDHLQSKEDIAQLDSIIKRLLAQK